MWRTFLTAGAVCVYLAVVSLSVRGGRGRRRHPMDADGDGRVSRKEFRGPDRAFDGIDTNDDGYATVRELRAFREKMEKEGRPARGSAESGPYPDMTVVVNNRDAAWKGTVLFTDNVARRVVEIDRDGRVVWECPVPEKTEKQNCPDGTCPAGPRGGCADHIADVELLPGGNILVMAGGRGVYEFNRDGKLAWSCANPTVSHDADRLPNGNTVMACAGAERLSDFPYEDPQAIEVNRAGAIVWSWHAKDEYADSRYKDIRSRDAGDWTHVNSVQRLPDGNTLISVRNWNLLVAVDRGGRTAWTTGGRGTIDCPHTPVVMDDGTIIVSEPIKGRVVIWDPKKKQIVWRWPARTWRRGGDYYFFRAAWPLPNGNIFMIDSCGQLLEVTRKGDIVWQVRKPTWERRSRPLRKEELGTAAPFFNADVRGNTLHGGR